MAHRRPKIDNEELSRTVEKIASGFFGPATVRLLRMSNDSLGTVRAYCILLLIDLATAHLPLFTARMLADIAFRLKTMQEDDPDERVRNCAKANLVRFLESAAEYGAACKAAKSSPPPPSLN